MVDLNPRLLCSMSHLGGGQGWRAVEAVEAYLRDPEKCEAERSWGGALAVSYISNTYIYNLLSVCSLRVFSLENIFSIAKLFTTFILN